MDQSAVPYDDVPPPTIGIVPAHALPQFKDNSRNFTLTNNLLLNYLPLYPIFKLAVRYNHCFV